DLPPQDEGLPAHRRQPRHEGRDRSRSGRAPPPRQAGRQHHQRPRGRSSLIRAVHPPRKGSPMSDETPKKKTAAQRKADAEARIAKSSETSKRPPTSRRSPTSRRMAARRSTR